MVDLEAAREHGAHLLEDGVLAKSSRRIRKLRNSGNYPDLLQKPPFRGVHNPVPAAEARPGGTPTRSLLLPTSGFLGAVRQLRGRSAACAIPPASPIAQEFLSRSSNTPFSNVAIPDDKKHLCALILALDFALAFGLSYASLVQ
jgi:hypothetical protein